MKYLIESEQVSDMSLRGGVFRNASSEVELTDYEVASLVNLMKAANSFEVDFIELKINEPVIYDKLYDACSELCEGDSNVTVVIPQPIIDMAFPKK